MLYQTFCKIKIEAESTALTNQPVQVDESIFEVRSQTNVGSLVNLQLKINFFAEVKPKRMDLDGSFENSKDPAQADIIDPSIFKRLFLSVAENTFSDRIIRNLSFLIMTKLLKKVIDDAVKESQLK